MADKTMGWQIWFVSNDKVVGCVGHTELMTSKLSAVHTFEWQSMSQCRTIASNLLSGVHPLDHHEKVTASIKWHESRGKS